MTVADIRTTSGDWNEELIRGIFCPFYVEAILRINRRIIGEDFWSCRPPPPPPPGGVGGESGGG
jgi:hypothetical protein